MELGLGQLRLAPETFWSMTLSELAAAAKGAGLTNSETMTRQSLAVLTQKFPD